MEEMAAATIPRGAIAAMNSCSLQLSPDRKVDRKALRGRPMTIRTIRKISPGQPTLKNVLRTYPKNKLR
jgi:hypothetical protein